MFAPGLAAQPLTDGNAVAAMTIRRTGRRVHPRWRFIFMPLIV
jgi:hypothetical protein